MNSRVTLIISARDGLRKNSGRKQNSIFAIVGTFNCSIQMYYNMNPTRYGEALKTPKCNTATFQKSPKHFSIAVFYNLSREIRDIEVITKFKIALKKFLLAKSFYSINDYFL